MESLLKKMEKEGAQLGNLPAQHFSYAISSYYIIATAEASSNLSPF
jgi:aspartyl-tRNA(Asn)/glutamyl-tRNA(Gln) amidotransferase subunit A